ncbi:hypothetical protein PCL_10956 [Purpureocillium lilacinum]|uniref:Uncharacterized protein n=1 Tax=Purpureocillium lilacinum TaxID=33203 RepID=A0A2U3ED08_PURLI|nr:hypothetical protein Purlil1_1641 [Purpureocillium lilacinum]PWI72333.1 hypothetical protein PCL_10956 [Purpureocillium lilacinum]
MICGYTAVGLIITIVFYAPPPRSNSVTLSTGDMVRRIDYVGGILEDTWYDTTLQNRNSRRSGADLVQYPWNSAHALVPLILGVSILAMFVSWEAWGTKYPMFPKDLGRAPRTLVLVLVISFISGANFFSVLMLWPTQAYNVYGHDPVAVGLRGLPFGLGVMTGCVITLTLLTYFRGANTRIILLIASCVMTAGCGSMAALSTANESVVYAILVIAGLGVGGMVIPVSVITTIICRDEVIATITALSLSIRVVGGAIGYAIYYNVLVSKLTPMLIDRVGTAMVVGGVKGPETIKAAIDLTSASLTQAILELPGSNGNVTLWQQVYCSIAFGEASVVASFFVEDMTQFMDDHVAVVIL